MIIAWCKETLLQTQLIELNTNTDHAFKDNILNIENIRVGYTLQTYLSGHENV